MEKKRVKAGLRDVEASIGLIGVNIIATWGIWVYHAQVGKRQPTISGKTSSKRLCLCVHVCDISTDS